MAELQRTNICCLDISKDCLDYLRSLSFNVFEGSLGSVFSIIWAGSYESKPVKVDCKIPVNLHEYHVIVHDMGNPNSRVYSRSEHIFTNVKSVEEKCIVCRYPITTFDLRPFVLNRILKGQTSFRRIEIVFVGKEVEVEYTSSIIGSYSTGTIGTFSNMDGWQLVSGKEKYGERVLLEEKSVSRTLFEGRLCEVNYYRVFTLPVEIEGGKRVTNSSYLSLLKNEEGECVAYAFDNNKGLVQFVLPQVKDKASLLKTLFEEVLFVYCSDFFPDIESKKWIHDINYDLPEEQLIKEEIEKKRISYQKEVDELEGQLAIVGDKYAFLKELITASGKQLVKAVKSYLEWLGFENVVDKDESLKQDELKEEDLCLESEGKLILIEVKGINGTSTDAECSQIDKIVSRRMRELDTTKVHGIYIVNNQKNTDPLNRQVPPFNQTQIKDAENQSRTMIYTSQLHALFFDIDRGYLTKEQVKMCFEEAGLANFHKSLESIGIPYKYYDRHTVLCFELKRKISLGDSLFYKDSLNRLNRLEVETIQQDKQPLDWADSGKTAIKVNKSVPNNREIYYKSLG